MLKQQKWKAARLENGEWRGCFLELDYVMQNLPDSVKFGFLKCDGKLCS